MSDFSYIAVPRAFEEGPDPRVPTALKPGEYGHVYEMSLWPVSSRTTFRDCFSNKFVYNFDASLDYFDEAGMRAAVENSTTKIDREFLYKLMGTSAEFQNSRTKIDRERLYKLLDSYLHDDEFCEIYTEFISGSYRKKFILGPPKKYETIFLDELLLTQKLIIQEDLKVTIKKRGKGG